MINKNQFSIKNTKKVLHKVGKQWVVVSAVLLGLAAGGAAVTTANADTTANASANHASVVSAAPSSANSSAAKPASANSTSAASSVSAAPSSAASTHAMRLGAMHGTDEANENNGLKAFGQSLINHYINKAANLKSGDTEYNNYEAAINGAESALDNASNGNLSNFWAALTSGSASSFLNEHAGVKANLSGLVNNPNVASAYSNVHSNASSAANNIFSDLNNLAGHPTDTNNASENAKNYGAISSDLNSMNSDIMTDPTMVGIASSLNNATNGTFNVINDVQNAADSASNEVNPTLPSGANTLVSAALNAIKNNPSDASDFKSAINDVASALNSNTSLSSFLNSARASLSSIVNKHHGAFKVAFNNAFSNLSASANNPAYASAYNIAHSNAGSVDNVLSDFNSFANDASSINNYSAMNNDLSNIASGINNSAFASVSGMSDVASAAISNEANPENALESIGAESLYNQAIKLASTMPNGYSILNSAASAAESALSANNVNSFISNILSNSAFKDHPTAERMINNVANEVKNNPSLSAGLNSAYTLASSNGITTKNVLSSLASLNSNNAASAFSNISSDIEGNTAFKSVGVLNNVASDASKAAQSLSESASASASISAASASASASISAASASNSASEAAANASTNTANNNGNNSNNNVPYIAPSSVSSSASASSVAPSSAVESNSAVAPTSASATKSASSEATKHNHKVAGHYVNVPNKHVALNGVSRNAKFYMGKKAVKVSPKALKRAKVVEAVRKGHHVTYLVRVGKRAYTVRGYVKNIKPVFANRKHVEVRVGRRDYKVNTKRVHVISAVREGANVRYNVKVGRKHGVVFAKVTKRVFVRNNARRSYARKHASRYYRSMKRGHYARANENIWVHSHKNFTKRNAKFELRRGAVVHVKRLVRAAGNVTRFVVRRGFISAEKSVVRLFK